MAVISKPSLPPPERFLIDLKFIANIDIKIAEFNDLLPRGNLVKLADQFSSSLTEAGKAILSIRPKDLTCDFFDPYPRVVASEFPQQDRDVPCVYIMLLKEDQTTNSPSRSGVLSHLQSDSIGTSETGSPPTRLPRSTRWPKSATASQK
jgi:hypothetical protein